jgi:hypothetical protein
LVKNIAIHGPPKDASYFWMHSLVPENSKLMSSSIPCLLDGFRILTTNRVVKRTKSMNYVKTAFPPPFFGKNLFLCHLSHPMVYSDTAVALLSNYQWLIRKSVYYNVEQNSSQQERDRYFQSCILKCHYFNLIVAALQPAESRSPLHTVSASHFLPQCYQYLFFLFSLWIHSWKYVTYYLIWTHMEIRT